MQNPTPQTPQYELVAHLNKIKGLDGQLIAQELGELSVLRPSLEVWVVPPALEGVRHTFITEATSNQHKPGVVLSLEGVNDRTEANKLVGRYLLAKVSELPGHTRAIPEGLNRTVSQELDVSGQVNFTDSVQGNLGQLDHIKQGPAYDIWVIEGPYGHLEIPAVDAYIIKEDADTIHLALPAGFIEITGI